MRNQISELEKNIGIEFTKKELLETSVTHRSYLNEHREVSKHNERLEFLGDAVLELIVSEFLFNEFPERAEGELTSFRSALVRTDSLAESAKSLRLGEYLQLSRGEEDSGGREKDYLLANAFEALLGAIYLDKGYEEAKTFIYKTLIPKLGDIVEFRLDIDNKTRIQELAQSEYKETPIYEVINEEGPDHDKIFTVVVKINDKIIGEGTGSSKQKAEERAAEVGIKYIESNK